MTDRATATPDARTHAETMATVQSVLRLARAGLGRAAIGMARGGRALGRLAATHRRVLVALGVRLAFWGALALWFATASTVVGDTPLDIDLALHRFVVGAAICAVAVLLAAARHVRWASWALGSLHGASATVLYLLVSG